MKSKKSKKILGLAVAAALVVSAASASMLTFAGDYTDFADVPGYSNNGTDADDSDDYLQRKLTFDSGFGDVSSAQLPYDGAMLAEGYAVDIEIPDSYVPEYPDEDTNYEFVGWSDADGNTYQPGDTVAVKAASTSLTAKWKYVGSRELSLKLDDSFSGEEEYSTATVEDKDATTFTVKAPEALSNRANTFLGWTVTFPDGTTKDVNAEENVEVTLNSDPEQDVVFKAKWEKTTFASYGQCFVDLEAESDKYDNEAMADGGVYYKYLITYSYDYEVVKDTATGDVSYKEGSEVKAPSASEAPTRDGYVFDGWLDVDNNVKYQPGDVVPYYVGILRAVYAVDPAKDTNTVRTVYFDGDKWTVAKTDEIAKDATSYEVEAPAALTNSENTFLKWEDADGNEYAPGDKIPVTDPAKLVNGAAFEFYAVWEKNTLTVERDVDLHLLLPSEYTAEGMGNPVFKVVNNKINVVLDLDTGKITLKTEQSITVPEDVPEVEGMEFKAWNENDDGTGKVYKAGDKIPVTVSYDGTYLEDISLYAMLEKSSGKGGSGKGGSVANPSTGDDFNAVPFAIAAVVALGAMAGVAVYKKKRESTEEAQ